MTEEGIGARIPGGLLLPGQPGEDLTEVGERTCEIVGQYRRCCAKLVATSRQCCLHSPVTLGAQPQEPVVLRTTGAPYFCLDVLVETTRDRVRCALKPGEHVHAPPFE